MADAQSRDGLGDHPGHQFADRPNPRLDLGTFPTELRREPAVGEDQDAVASHEQHGVLAAETAQIADVGRVGDQKGLNLVALETASQSLATRRGSVGGHR